LKVEISISQTKSGQQLCLTNVNFDQYHVGKKSNKTVIEHNCCPDLVWFYVLKKALKTTYSSIVELNQNNCQRKNCRTSHLLWNLGLKSTINKIIDWQKLANKISQLSIILIEENEIISYKQLLLKKITI
jgi:hypothetical protein